MYVCRMVCCHPTMAPPKRARPSSRSPTHEHQGRKMMPTTTASPLLQDMCIVHPLHSSCYGVFSHAATIVPPFLAKQNQPWSAHPHLIPMSDPDTLPAGKQAPSTFLHPLRLHRTRRFTDTHRTQNANETPKKSLHFGNPRKPTPRVQNQ